MDESRIQRLASACHIMMICIYNDGSIAPFSDATGDNPLWVSKELQRRMIDCAASRDVPYIYRDDSAVYFICIHSHEVSCLLGPVSIIDHSRPEVRHFYRNYGITSEDCPDLRTVTYQRLIDMISLFAEEITGQCFSDEILLSANGFSDNESENIKKGKAVFDISEDDINEDSATWRHSYRQEVAMLSALKEGNTKEALRITHEMDEDAGRLSSHGLDH